MLYEVGGERMTTRLRSGADDRVRTARMAGRDGDLGRSLVGGPISDLIRNQPQ